METRHKDALRRITQADAAWRTQGHEPSSFHLLHSGAMQRIIDHPCWDPSWAVPSEHTIDDLSELGLLRGAPSSNKRRTFTMTMKGRREGEALIEQLTTPTRVAGRAPRADEVLDWLVSVAAESPESMDLPVRLLDRAVTDQLIETSGRDVLARRILGLLADGLLRGDVPDFDQATAEQRSPTRRTSN